MNHMRSHEGHGLTTHGRAKINVTSLLLLPEENEAVFKLLGRKCQTLSTAVVQIYKTEPSAHAHWKKKHTGVMCFVKDSAIRSYFLRAYCLMKHELIWEHELYDGMKISKARTFLLTFEGEDGHVGLNFVSEEECDAFYRAVNNTIETRNRKKLEKRNRLKSQVAPAVPVTPLPREPIQNDNVVQLRNHSKIGSVNLMPAQTSQSTHLLPPATTTASTKNFFSFSSSSSSHSNKDKKRKVTKADISQPTNFMHISHVGWDANKGFDLTGSENDEVLSQFFAKAGVSETELKDRDTRAFIYDFIQSNNVLSTVKLERVEKPTKTLAPSVPTIQPMTVAKPLPPPPVPSRHQHHQYHNTNGGPPVAPTSQRVAPPPPPARQPPPPIPTTIPGLTKQAAPSTKPPPLSSMAMPPPPPIPTSQQQQNQNVVPPPAVPPAPPPPPPPAISVVPIPPPPPPPQISEPSEIPSINVTQQQQTKAPSSLPIIPDTRNELMESIRKGVQLKKVDTSALSTGSGDSHSDLMSEIRMGIELKPTQSRELANRNSDEFSGTDALANALRRALQERGRVMQSSDEESTSSGNDEEWDD